MTADLHGALDRREVVELDSAVLPAILATATVVSEHDTVLSGAIRILELGERLVVQESDPEGTVYLRAMADQKAAEAFVSDRLATYERMWDGCGCKVHYRS